jgi:hypothetical protein
MPRMQRARAQRAPADQGERHNRLGSKRATAKVALFSLGRSLARTGSVGSTVHESPAQARSALSNCCTCEREAGAHRGARRNADFARALSRRPGPACHSGPGQNPARSLRPERGFICSGGCKLRCRNARKSVKCGSGRFDACRSHHASITRCPHTIAKKRSPDTPPCLGAGV